MSRNSISNTLFNALFASVAGSLVARLRTEFALAKAELQLKLRNLASGAAFLVVAAVFSFFMVGVLLAAAVIGLANVMPAWAAALVVAGGLLLFVLIFGLIGASKVKKNKDLVPHRAIDAVKGAMPGA